MTHANSNFILKGSFFSVILFGTLRNVVGLSQDNNGTRLSILQYEFEEF